MARKLIYYGHPTLRRKAEEVGTFTDDLISLVQDMLRLMEEHHGMGLAAPQVDVSQRVFITCVPTEDDRGEVIYPEPTVYVNPVLTSPSQEVWEVEEGCLSVPNLRVMVERPMGIHVKAQNLNGEWFEEELAGWNARCVMHENDHLNGVLHVDRVRGKARQEIEPLLREIKQKYR